MNGDGFRKYLMRMPRLPIVLILAAAQLAACRNEDVWRLVDVEGRLPDLSFTMTRASDGRAVTAEDYRGKVVILEFGFTSCPDICPTTLVNLASALADLGSLGEDVRVLFVTVDPARDTADALARYVSSFSPKVDGLVGTPDQLADLARRFRVAYSVTPSDSSQGYEVMHGSTIYFFDRAGRIKLLAQNADKVRDVTHDLRRLVEEPGS